MRLFFFVISSWKYLREEISWLVGWLVDLHPFRRHCRLSTSSSLGITAAADETAAMVARTRASFMVLSGMKKGCVG